MQTQPSNPFEYLSAHWAHMLGWSALITLVYKIYLGFKEFWGFGKGISDAKADLELIKTNHLPHLQAEVERVNDNLTGLREEIKEGFERLSRDLGIVLGRME